MNHKKRILVNFIYAVALFYMVFKASFYYYEVDWGPDVRAHLSYMYYEWEHPGQLIPQFEEIYMLDFDILGERAYITGTTEDVCYLGHPPLYYKLMSICGAIRYDPQGALYMDMHRIHVCNVVLVMAGILLCLQWGRRYIHKLGDNLSLHFLYAAIVSTLPMISYIGSNISNDNILYLDVALVLWGLQRGAQGKRDYITYVLIAIGTAMSVLSKLTLGLALMVGLAVVVLCLICREKSFRLLWCREFAVTLPVYLLCLAYFLTLLANYHTVQPGLSLLSAESYARSEWAMMGSNIRRTLWESIVYFWHQFWGTWTAVYGHAFSMSRQGTPAAMVYYGYMCLFLIYILVSIVRCICNKTLPEELPMIGLGVGSIAAFFYQMKRNMGSYMNGGDGGYQARYYIYAIAVFALCSVQLLQWGYRQWKDKKRISGALTAFTVIYGAALIYFDFWYFLVNFESYRVFV